MIEGFTTVNGKVGISAKVICDSISPQGVRLTTMEIEYPRIILSELNTHRMLSKNSASSRAIPWPKMKKQLTARPVRFGQANAGMQDKGEDFTNTVHFRDGYNQDWWWSHEYVWQHAKEDAVRHADAMYEAGYHKQVISRLTEPFCMMKTVISGTEWENLFWLRDDDAADPTIHELARCMKEARQQSEPMLIHAGEYHLPYVERHRDSIFGMQYFIDNPDDRNGLDVIKLDTELAIKVSCARSCAVSFRGVDYGIEKCLDVYDNKLLGQDKIHGSALEHVATPMKAMHFYNGVNVPGMHTTWQEGITHVDRKGNLWSGNFKGFVQHRKMIAGENKEG